MKFDWLSLFHLRLMDIDKDGVINKNDLRAAFDNVGEVVLNVFRIENPPKYFLASRIFPGFLIFTTLFPKMIFKKLNRTPRHGRRAEPDAGGGGGPVQLRQHDQGN